MAAAMRRNTARPSASACQAPCPRYPVNPHIIHPTAIGLPLASPGSFHKALHRAARHARSHSTAARAHARCRPIPACRQRSVRVIRQLSAPMLPCPRPAQHVPFRPRLQRNRPRRLPRRALHRPWPRRAHWGRPLHKKKKKPEHPTPTSNAGDLHGGPASAYVSSNPDGPIWHFAIRHSLRSRQHLRERNAPAGGGRPLRLQPARILCDFFVGRNARSCLQAVYRAVDRSRHASTLARKNQAESGPGRIHLESHEICLSDSQPPHGSPRHDESNSGWHRARVTTAKRRALPPHGSNVRFSRRTNHCYVYTTRFCGNRPCVLPARPANRHGTSRCVRDPGGTCAASEPGATARADQPAPAACRAPALEPPTT